MNEFGFWVKWGTGLTDAAFASAWVALGLAARAAPPPGTTFRAELVRALARGDRDGELDWSFPRRADAKKLGRLTPDQDAPSWAKLWADVAPGAVRPIRLRVTGAPPDEAAPPWFRMLSEAVPAPASASMVLPDRPLDPDREWPPRVAALPGGGGRLALDGSYRRVETAEPSDLLVHLGDPESFLRASKVRRTGAARVVVLRCSLNRPWVELERALEEIQKQRSASGWVLLSEHASDEDVARVIDAAVHEAGRGAPLDVAFARGRSQGGGFDLVSGLTPALAAFRFARPMAKAARPPGPVVHGAFPPPAAPPPAAPTAAAPPTAKAAPPPQGSKRFLQQRSFVERGGASTAAEGGFVAGVDALVLARIGASDDAWDTLARPFPSHLVPAGEPLTFWLTEPDHLPHGVQGEVRMGDDGATPPCRLRFVPKDAPRFEGRLTVLHRNRVLQTAILRAAVRKPGEAGTADGTPKLHQWIPVRRLGPAAADRRTFDAAFVLNHDGAGRPLAHAMSEKGAWVSNITGALDIAKKINAALVPVATSVDDFEDGLEGENGRKLLVELARHGKGLATVLVGSQLKEQPHGQAVIDSEFLQIVSTRPDAVVPFEFIYDRPLPDDDAEVCKYWRDALASPPGKRRETACLPQCDAGSGRVVCPLGFWGLRKVIERHAFAPELADSEHLYVVAEEGRQSDTLPLAGAAVVGASTRVPEPELTALLNTLEQRGAAPVRSRTWDGWREAVGKRRPRVLLALAHAEGVLTDMKLEIGGVMRWTAGFEAPFVHPVPTDPKPLVALLGCDTAGSAVDYGLAVPTFREAGAAVVIATISTVFGEHAAQVARSLVEGLIPAPGAPAIRLGEALRDLKRKALLDHFLMPLCLVAYGDADWMLTR